METFNILGVIGALVIGVVLGITGGGGSILTVPILVYLLGVMPITATAYSLFIVGITALFGTFRNIMKGTIDFRVAFVFSIPAFIAVYLTRNLIIPSIPTIIFAVQNFVLTKDLAIMIFFAFIMFFSAISMIRTRKNIAVKQVSEFNFFIITIEGFVIGMLTGLVGAGGGFLIIPALVLFANLPMKKAVATSLMIISIKSLIGFLGDIGNIEIDWEFLLMFSILSIIGIIIGIYLNNFIESKKIKKAFGWFLLVMAIYIIIKEILF
ncbi:MAG: sulfite exporter TauE/SafE family protein [Flavobacteriales bacterium]|nr:sulfite exporter TauE/SafE family protein [Flavobacteriales bacterium]MBT5089690.1 sulfite exporter TauE/SafE family protein [Flavobacteriales bacterium]